ncbi:Retrotransposon nucleocapsid protein [Phytophthora megakarya]|uniref:Retrotransposon nucleocapsid protein n=1 Tax=Phytophthora megakarya TaxID=4795 RepID=A0A225W4Y9_9STRA|nr:Retrotransposon nucleocapsid protein [Phytophthora megakarya]
MDLDFKSYVQSCEACMRYKSSTGHFITHLPVSDGFDAIMVVVDKLSKRPVYIMTHTTATSKDTATLFFNNVFRYYGIPTTIVSDRDPKFTSKFWKALVNMMKITTGMTMAHRAQADVQTERQNRTLEDSLTCSISYHGYDWNEHLPMIEHAHATLMSGSSKMSPFFVDTGRKPRNPLNTSEQITQVAQSRVEYASRFVHHRQNVIARARKNLLEAQVAQKKFYDRRRSEEPFKAGELALLSTQDLNISHATAETTLRSRKFIPRFIGPYRIKDIKGNVLVANLKHLSPRFNIAKRKVYTSNPARFAGRVIPKSTPVIFDDDNESLHVIEGLMKKRVFNRQLEYLVKWHGLPYHENTWDESATSNMLATGKDYPRISTSTTAQIELKGYGSTNSIFNDDFDSLGAGGHSTGRECNDLHVPNNKTSSDESTYREPSRPLQTYRLRKC